MLTSKKIAKQLTSSEIDPQRILSLALNVPIECRRNPIEPFDESEYDPCFNVL